MVAIATDGEILRFLTCLLRRIIPFSCDSLSFYCLIVPYGARATAAYRFLPHAVHRKPKLVLIPATMTLQGPKISIF